MDSEKGLHCCGPTSLDKASKQSITASVCPYVQACGELAWTKYQGYGRDNTSTVTELLASFFVLYHKVIERWSRERSTGLRCDLQLCSPQLNIMQAVVTQCCRSMLCLMRGAHGVIHAGTELLLQLSFHACLPLPLSLQFCAMVLLYLQH